LRVFIAVDINEHEIISSIRRTQDELMASHSSELRPVGLENLHLTLKFLGEVDERIVETVNERVRRIKYPRFKIRVKGLGYFPGGGRVNVIWAGIAEGVEQLRGLHTLVEDEMESLGFRRDSFSPHLTICRVKAVRDKRLLLSIISRQSETEYGWQDIDTVKVKKSTLTPYGPIYTDLVVHRLGEVG
jgi:2'-5' RNA ligase